MIVLDTDHISALQHRDAPKAFALQARLETFSPDEIATTVITIEEQTRGWLGLIRKRLAHQSCHPEPFDCAQDKLREGSLGEILRCAQNDMAE